MPFEVHVPEEAQDYARYRPSYPEELFKFLASMVPGHDLAWDVGTGNGQAAWGLTPYFNRIVATDPSTFQIEHAKAHAKIEYLVAEALCPRLQNQTVDLVTVAQALHWFHFDEFYREVKRVLVAGGIFAAWAYPLHRITPEVDPIMRYFYHEVVGPYWPPERRLVEERYTTIPFPFEEIKSPPITFTLKWDLKELLGYLGTWSASRAYQKAQGRDPRLEIQSALEKVWGNKDQKRTIHWDLILKLGRNY